eukprot:2523660-Prymnesium_polylepis.1
MALFCWKRAKSKFPVSRSSGFWPALMTLSECPTFQTRSSGLAKHVVCKLETGNCESVRHLVAEVPLQQIPDQLQVAHKFQSRSLSLSIFSTRLNTPWWLGNTLPQKTEQQHQFLAVNARILRPRCPASLPSSVNSDLAGLAFERSPGWHRPLRWLVEPPC